MAAFNFGMIGNLVETAQHANAGVHTGPVSDVVFSFEGLDAGDFNMNQDRIFTIYGTSAEFVWGEKWGNNKTRVSQ